MLIRLLLIFFVLYKLQLYVFFFGNNSISINIVLLLHGGLGLTL